MSVCGGSASAARASTQELTITVSDGTALACGLILPSGAAPAGGWPGVILFHGLGPRILLGVCLHLLRHDRQVECRCAAVQAEVARLRDPVILVLAAGVDVDLREQGAKQLAPAAP